MNNSNENEENGEYYTPYDEANQVNNPLMEKKGTTSMILGIIAIVSAITGFLTPVALVLGIIALVKGKKYRKENTNAKAGYVLGIISIIIAAVLIIGFFLMMSRGFGYHSVHTSMYGTRSLINGSMHGSVFYQNGPHMYHKFF
jgi:uncharacterized membrane-anchored protein